ncbi:RagB/SusD family nutrient uptake outer membrane protein [Pedobacter sp. ASV1-7]|uniref:RagB/SusD family nutrient uptake outer membrane protein n=1 Tax=Pedobacter sp. ASV1-7 TaxID=3145237 RepID=UPI0032E85E11
MEQVKCIVYKLRQLTYVLLGGIIFLQMSSCRNFLSIDPPRDQIISNEVFKDEVSATAALTGIYSRMMEEKQGFASGGIRSVTYLTSLSADELTEVTPGEFYRNQLLPINGIINGYLWSEPYQYIYSANTIIAQLKYSLINESVKKQLIAEAKFVRSFCYFYLINLFGDVPLYLTADYRLNRLVSRTSKDIVYEQIIKDLIDVQSELSDQFSPKGRIRPGKWAATALLARCYLYVENWSEADNHASTIISRSDLFSIPKDLDAVFLSSSPEAIWQLYPRSIGENTYEAGTFIIPTVPGNSVLSSSLLNSFEQYDLRRIHWINHVHSDAGLFYYPFKYKITSRSSSDEYSVIFRLAEQYLIRSEARAHLNRIKDAQADLNVIRGRAGLDNITASDQASLLGAIELERQKELFTEWGHRWLDLKRTNRVDQVLKSIKSPNWQKEDALYPIPMDEISRNKNIKQNNGYK